MPEPLRYTDVPTPIGTFRVVVAGRTLRVVDLVERGIAQSGVPPEAVRQRGRPSRGSPADQIREYFLGRRTEFDLELDPVLGSEFDRSVWRALREVPAGRTVSYGELARRSGHPGAARAVGGAMHRNPIPIVIPCHRVVGDDASLTGYGLGLWRKRWLLAHEGAWPLRSRSAEGPRDPSQRTLDGLGERGVPPAPRRERIRSLR